MNNSTFNSCGTRTFERGGGDGRGGDPSIGFGRGTIKTRVKAGNYVLKQRCDAIESAWGLKQNGIFDEGEWIAEIHGEIQDITSRTRLSLSSQQDAYSARGAAAPSQHPPAAAAGTARRKVERGQHARERAAKGTLGGNICNACSIGSGQPIERTRGGVEEFVSGISFPPPAPESRRSCPHCPMTFVNEQGLGIHVRTQHSSAHMSNGVGLRRMLLKDVGGSVLPWEAAGPGRCWHVKFDRATGTASRYDYRFKANNAVNQLRILEDNAADLWKEEERTPLPYLKDRLKVHYSNIVKWAKDEKAIVAAAADDVKKSLLAKQQPKRWFPEAEKRKLKVSTLWLTITVRKLVREMYPGDQRAATFRASFRAPDESDVSAITTVAERESRVPQVWPIPALGALECGSSDFGILERAARYVGGARCEACRHLTALSWPREKAVHHASHLGPGEKTLRISVIFRGTGKRISPVEKAAYHKDVDVFFQENAWADQKFCTEWAKRSYREGLMRGRGELPKARSLLIIMDSLHAQTTDEFKEYLAKECNNLAWYGPSECTDELLIGGYLLITQWIGAAMARLNSQQAFRFRLFEKCGMAMTVDGSGDDRITLEGLDKPYTFANDEDCSEDEEGLENGSDEPEGRGKEGDGRTSQTQTDELALLDDDDSMDPQDPEDETQGMEIPTGVRIQEVKPVALDRLLLRRGVFVRLWMGWFGGLIIQQSQQDTRHQYDYSVQLELDQSTRKMKLPLDK
ncbi:unnamed protein product [Ectocarpus sp. CCAP 1310/34]|nr:unnamed protein product [Ectocarpus sp. CCAP 1310/34]